MLTVTSQTIKIWKSHFCVYEFQYMRVWMYPCLLSLGFKSSRMAGTVMEGWGNLGGRFLCIATVTVAVDDRLGVPRSNATTCTMNELEVLSAVSEFATIREPLCSYKWRDYKYCMILKKLKTENFLLRCRININQA